MRAITFAAFQRPDETFEVDPGFVIELDALPDQEPDGESIEVRALGETGEALAATRVPLVDPCAPPTGDRTDSPARTAVGLVAVPQGATVLEAVLDNVVVWRRRRPEKQLDVDVEWPDTVERGPVQLSWQSSAEGCQAAVGWTADGGKTTSPLSLPTASESIAVDVRHSPGGPDCAFILQVTDGWSTIVRRSPALHLPVGGWQVSILAPADHDEIPVGEPVLLAGQAFHLEEQRPSDDLEWSSSITGGLGQGSRVLVAFEPGEHVITARLGEASASVPIHAGVETSGKPARN